MISLIPSNSSALGVSLGTMVANLSAHKRGWDDRWEEFSEWAEKGQAYKNKLLFLVDEDTNSFNKVIDGFRMPKGTDNEIKLRQQAIEDATKYATEIPFQVMETAFASMEVMQAMIEEGLANSLSDAAVGILCARTAVTGAYFNVRINAKDIADKSYVEAILNKAKIVFEASLKIEEEMMQNIDSKM